LAFIRCHMAEHRIVNVRVTNETKPPVTFSDDYNGVHYVFEPNRTVSIPLDAAKHIFGYDIKNADTQSMFEHICKRWGWNTPENVKDNFAAIKLIWSKLSFAPVAVKMVEHAIVDPTALEDAPEEVPPAKAAPGKLRLGQQAIAASA
jgi:hypothetical protein